MVFRHGIYCNNNTQPLDCWWVFVKKFLNERTKTTEMHVICTSR